MSIQDTQDYQKPQLKMENRVDGDGFHVIRFIKKERIHGEVIGKIASGLGYVHKHTPVSELAYDFDRHRELYAVGVVDDDNRLLGIVVRKELFDILGKPYGRDILKHKTVERVLEGVEVFDHERNIFSVSEQISEELRLHTVTFFLLIDSDCQFRGIFTSRDVLIYLSDMTQKDVMLARSLQRAIVPESLSITGARYSIAGGCRMAKGVGGDYYSVRGLDNGRTIISVCDVSGKGVSASLLTAQISGMMAVYDNSHGLKNLVQTMNRVICQSFEQQKFVTGIFMEFNPDTGELELYDMGHSMLYLFKESRLFKLNTSMDNLPLGVDSAMEPKADRFRLVQGDILAVMTDGISEQVNPAGQAYGEKKLIRFIKAHRYTGVSRVMEELYADVYRFRETQPQHDDMTLVLLDYSRTS